MYRSWDLDWNLRFFIFNLRTAFVLGILLLGPGGLTCIHARIQLYP